MLSIYSSYRCTRCNKEFVVLTEDIGNFKGYLSCPYCNNRKIKKLKLEDSLKDCMSERYYKKVHGAIRQVSQK